MSIPYHAWTHTPGGTDPIPMPGAAGQWCRVWLQTSDQTVTPGNQEIVLFDTVNNPYTDYFDTTTAPGVGGSPSTSAIVVKKPGVYAFTYRLDLDDYPDVPFTTGMHRIDYSPYLYYERTHEPSALTGTGVHDSYVFRYGPTYDGDDATLYVLANNPSASANNLVINAFGFHLGRGEASYMEIIRISAADIVGDPSPA